MRVSGKTTGGNLLLNSTQVVLPPKQIHAGCSAQLPEVPIARTNSGTAQSNGLVYNCGGRDILAQPKVDTGSINLFFIEAGIDTSSLQADCFLLDLNLAPSTWEWRPIAPMPAVKFKVQIFAVNGGKTVYAIEDNIVKYDLDTDSWTEVVDSSSAPVRLKCVFGF